MEAHPGQGQSSTLYGFLKRPRTEEDYPLLSVKQIRFKPEALVRAQQHGQEMEFRAEAERAIAPAVRMWAGCRWIQ
eukprot:1140281-Pelagomonas_calceolata.AAC.5